MKSGYVAVFLAGLLAAGIASAGNDTIVAKPPMNVTVKPIQVPPVTKPLPSPAKLNAVTVPNPGVIPPPAPPAKPATGNIVGNSRVPLPASENVTQSMMEVRKQGSKDARDDRKLDRKTRELSLNAKEAKLKQDNASINQGMSESKEKASRLMDDAAISLQMGTVQGVQQIGGDVVRISPATKTKVPGGTPVARAQETGGPMLSPLDDPRLKSEPKNAASSEKSTHKARVGDAIDKALKQQQETSSAIRDVYR